MFPEPCFITTNGIRMAVYEHGTGPAVILLHGFPELAYSWRHQLQALADAGFHAIAPDQRGYGQTDKPANVDAYALQPLIADIVGLLDAFDIDKAFIAGHDWGALLVWQMALLRPERMAGLIALNIPFIPRPDVDPIATMRAKLGDDFYIVNFQDSAEADRRFDADPARVFEVMMRRGVITRVRFNLLPRSRRALSLLAALDRKTLRGEPLLTDAEAAVFTAAFTNGGFTGPINWYRNWTRNWEATAGVEQTVRVPSLFIGAVDDVVISLGQIEAMKPHVPDLEIHMLKKCGHWTQQERPDEVNAILIDWLTRHRV